MTVDNEILENGSQQITEVIQVENLKKNYNNFKALKGISFSVKKGEIFGFLGPNGAGKTTTIHILSTLTLPTSGLVFVNGFNVLTRPDMVRRSIGLVFQETTLDTHLTAEENLFLHAYLYGVPKKEFNQRKREVLKLCELWDKRKWRVENFSGGMKRRLEISRALIHWPQILFLDEPTVGLDPQTRTKIWDYIFTARKHKETTIFLTTQYLNEAENCDRIAIIDNGEIVALDTPENLKKMIGEDIISFRTLDNELAEKEFKEKFPEYKLKKIGKELKIEVENGDEFLPILVKAISPKIISIELRRPSLDDVFLEVTGRKIRDDETLKAVEEEEKFNLADLFSLFPKNNKKNKT